MPYITTNTHPEFHRLCVLRDAKRIQYLACLLLLALLTTACTTQRIDKVCNCETEAIDPEKAVTIADSNLSWFDALELGVEGQGWQELKHPYDRLPAEAEGVVRDAVWRLSQDSAGLSVRFITDSSKIDARWSLRNAGLDMHHMPSVGDSGLDLYVKHQGQWQWVGVGRPKQQEDNQWTLIADVPEGFHEYRLYLPLYNGIEKLQIGIAPGATLRQAPTCQCMHNKPVLFWGTSILQGGCASRPGMAYPSIIGRRIHRPVINLGFSGNGKMDPELVELIAQLDVAAYVIDCLPNMTTEMVAERAAPLVKTIREAHPDTPIILVENVHYQNAWFIASKQQVYEQKNAALKQTYKQLRSEGIKKLYYVPGDNLYGHDNEATVDGVHASDLGFLRLADGVEPTLRKALK